MLIFLYLQNPYKKIIAIAERNHIMTSEGIAIYLPKTPEVLIKRVAKTKLDKLMF